MPRQEGQGAQVGTIQAKKGAKQAKGAKKGRKQAGKGPEQRRKKAKEGPKQAKKGTKRSYKPVNSSVPEEGEACIGSSCVASDVVGHQEACHAVDGWVIWVE